MRKEDYESAKAEIERTFEWVERVAQGDVERMEEDGRITEIQRSWEWGWCRWFREEAPEGDERFTVESYYPDGERCEVERGVKSDEIAKVCATMSEGLQLTYSEGYYTECELNAPQRD